LIREFYDTESATSPVNSPVSRTPALCCVFGVNSLASLETIIGSVRFRAKFSFRQRAALDNGPVFGKQITFHEDPDGRQYKEVIDADETVVAKSETPMPLTKS